MTSLSTILLTKNSQSTVLEAIAHHGQFSSEILVVDLGSDDATVDLVYGSRVAIARIPPSKNDFSSILEDIKVLVRTDCFLVAQPDERLVSNDPIRRQLTESLDSKTNVGYVYVDTSSRAYRTVQPRLFRKSTTVLPSKVLSESITEPIRILDVVFSSITGNGYSIKSEGTTDNQLIEHPGLSIRLAIEMMNDGNFEKALAICNGFIDISQREFRQLHSKIRLICHSNLGQVESAEREYVTGNWINVKDLDIVVHLARMYSRVYALNDDFEVFDKSIELFNLAKTLVEKSAPQTLLCGLRAMSLDVEKNNLVKKSRGYV